MKNLFISLFLFLISPMFGISFSKPIKLNTDTYGCYSPVIKINSEGRCIALWQAYLSDDNTTATVQCCLEENDWEQVQSLFKDGCVSSYVASFNNNQEAIVASILKREDESVDLEAVRFTNGSWDAQENLETDIGNSYVYLDSSLNDEGQASVILSFYSSLETDQAAMFLYSGGNWSVPLYLPSPCYEAAVAICNTAPALATWVSDPNSIQSAEYSSSWKNFQTLETSTEYMQNAQLQMNTKGRAVAFFTDTELKASIWEDGIWQNVQSFSNGLQARCAINNSGDAIGIWVDNLALPEGQIKSSCYKQGSWSPPITVHNIIQFQASVYPQIAMNDQGDAIAIWSIFSTSPYALIYYSLYDAKKSQVVRHKCY